MSGIPTPDADGKLAVTSANGGSVLVPGAVLVSVTNGYPALIAADGEPACFSLTSNGGPTGTIPVAAASSANTKRYLTNGVEAPILVQEITLSLKCGTLDLDGFGAEAAALTNGVTIKIMDDLNNTILDPITASPIKTNAQGIAASARVSVVEAGSQTILTMTWALPRAAFVMPGQRVEMNVGDSLASTEVQASIASWVLSGQ